VVEVTSPSNALYDKRTKADTYRAMRVRELWLIDPEAREIEVRSFESGHSQIYKTHDVVRSEILPEIKILVSALF
jgi:Uma2 family endonuclease